MLRQHAAFLCLAMAAPVVAVPGSASADPLSIYDIQYTADPNGDSPHDGQTVDCAGGVVTHKFSGRKPRVILQDPNRPDGWAGIQVKDWTASLDLFDHVSTGDWVSLTNVVVEEFYGTTFLQWDPANGAEFSVVSSGNPVPGQKILAVSEMAAPVEDPNGNWFVVDHGAEKYESMRVAAETVAVTGMNLGKASDNYELSDGAAGCWASDYMNADRGEGDYHPYVGVGHHLLRVGGVLEQYTQLFNGWDYYQLLTTSTEDLVPVSGDANMDGIVNVGDLGILGANYKTGPDKTWFDGDFNGDGIVNVGDLGILGANYQYGIGGTGGRAAPEPATVVLALAGIMSLLGRRRRPDEPL